MYPEINIKILRVRMNENFIIVLFIFLPPILPDLYVNNMKVKIIREKISRN